MVISRSDGSAGRCGRVRLERASRSEIAERRGCPFAKPPAPSRPWPVAPLAAGATLAGAAAPPKPAEEGPQPLDRRRPDSAGARSRRRSAACRLFSRCSRSARRSGVSKAPPKRSRASTGGRRAAGPRRARRRTPPRRPRARGRRGPCPSGIRAKRSDRPGFRRRQRQFGGAMGGLQAGRVAVEAEDRLAGGAPEQIELALGQRGAERGDGMLEARLGERDDVHVALDDDQRLRPPRRPPRAGEIVEHLPLVEDVGVRRVEIFRLRVGRHGAAAEGDDRLVAQVLDREHDPVAEPIVGDGDVRAVDDEPGGLDLGACRRPSRRDAPSAGCASPARSRGRRLLGRRRQRRGRADRPAPSRRPARAARPGRSSPPCAWRRGSSPGPPRASRRRGRAPASAAPASAASRSTASGKLMPSSSVRKRKWSPDTPQPKQW